MKLLSTPRPGSRMTSGRRVSLLAVAALALPMAAFGVTSVSATTSTAVGPYTIQGIVPDAGIAAITDAAGNAKELGPLNSNTTKIGVIHNDAVPTLGATNPNSSVDLNTAWLDLRRVGTQDYLYFAWQRDANSGSGFIAYEFMQQAAPVACAYDSKTNQELIDGCNPFANRAAGDFMILWDQQGGKTALTLRTWEGTAPNLTLSAGTTLAPGLNAAAHYSADGFNGEAAVNLTAYGLSTAASCLTLANTIPSTVTGNSDQADYKDTVLTTKSLTTCGSITIIKNSLNGNATFPFTGASTTGATVPTGLSSFDLTTVNGTVSRTFTNVPIGGYTVTEGADPTDWTFVSVTCTATGTGTSTSTTAGSKVATITLAGSGTATCTFTNKTKVSPSITTKISPVDGVATTSTAVGTSVFDTATLSGATSGVTGTVTYSVYTDSACANLAVVGTDIDAQPTAVTISSGAVPNSAIVTFLRAGSYQFQAVYGGDANNFGATSVCGSEPLTVTLAPPTVSTAQDFLPNDTLTLAGGYNPTGTVTFKLFGPNDTNCSGATSVINQTVTVSGNGEYSTTNTTTLVTTPGTYRWLSTYSGDGNNNGVTSACGVEQFSFTNTNS